jgi:hypothetical protein
VTEAPALPQSDRRSPWPSRDLTGALDHHVTMAVTVTPVTVTSVADRVTVTPWR